MGAGGSKAAARAYKAAEAAGGTAAGASGGAASGAARSGAAAAAAADAGAPAAAAAGAIARDEAAAAAVAAAGGRRPMTLEEEERLEAKDQGLDQLLNKLGGSVHGTRITVTPPREALLRRQPVTLEGRLPPEALRQLFHLQADAEGGGVDISGHHNIAKYKPDPALIRRVLARACLPETVEAQGTQDVRVFADWPPWFRRRSDGGM